MSINESSSDNVDYQLDANFLDRQHSNEVGVSYPVNTPRQPRNSLSLEDSLNESKEYWLGQVEKNAGALSNELRDYLVAEIHRLLDIDDWEEGDVPPTQRFIWRSELVNESDNSIGSNGNSIFNAEIGYGFEVLDDSAVLTPYSAFDRTKFQGSELQLGSRIATSKGINFDLEVVRDIPKTGTLEHEYNLSGSINW